MTTTALSVETILIGFQVYIWMYLSIVMFSGYHWIDPKKILIYKDWSTVILFSLLGISYILGMIFQIISSLLFAPVSKWKWHQTKSKMPILIQKEITEELIKNSSKIYSHVNELNNNWRKQFESEHPEEISKVDDLPKYIESIYKKTIDHTFEHFESKCLNDIDYFLKPENSYKFLGIQPEEMWFNILFSLPDISKKLEQMLNNIKLVRATTLNFTIISVLGFIIFFQSFGFTWFRLLICITIILLMLTLVYISWINSYESYSIKLYLTLMHLRSKDDKINNGSLAIDNEP